MKILITEEQKNFILFGTPDLLTETFFDRELDAFMDFYESVKDLFSNLKFISRDKHKMTFFVDRITETVIKLKHYKVASGKIGKVERHLKKEFDGDLIDKFGIFKLLGSLDGDKKVKEIDDFVSNLKKKTRELMDDYHQKLKDDKTYDVFNIMKDDESKVPFYKFEKEKFFLQIELLKLQEWVIANNKKFLFVFEGRDTSGKSANIENLTENLNPKHYRVESFDIPTESEKKNWFKRYEKVLPKEGEIVFFDRSWYNRGTIDPAMGYCTKEEYEEFMEKVLDFEKGLIKKEIQIVKIWLDIKKNKQMARFEIRILEPLKYWKFSKNDEKIMKKWDKLTPYIDRVLKETHTEETPWNIINADDKLNALLNTSKLILKMFDYDKKNYELFGQTKSIIFLDIHGVIITDIEVDKDGKRDCTKGYNKDCVNYLNKLTDLSGAKIVVISDCKKRMSVEELEKCFKDEGITGKVIGKTVDINKKLRTLQIKDWFKSNDEPRNWVVLDDTHYDDYSEIPDHVVFTKSKKGLGKSEFESALKILE